MSSEELTFTAMGEHLLWLSSIGNDMIYLQTQVTQFSDLNFEYTTELLQKKQEFLNLSQSTIVIAMDAMSCIIFKSFDGFLPCSDIYHKWVADYESKNLTERVVGELIWYMKSNVVHLKPYCSKKLFQICLRKLTTWYFSFLNECYLSKLTLTDDDIQHIAEDCCYIYEQLSPLINRRDNDALHVYSGVPGVVIAAQSNQYDDESSMLNRFLQIMEILTFTSGTSNINQTLTDILTECDECHYKASALSRMLRAVFRLHCFVTGYEERLCEEEENDSTPYTEEWFAMKIEMVTASIKSIPRPPSSPKNSTSAGTDAAVILTPEMLVWTKRRRAPLAQLLVKSSFT